MNRYILLAFALLILCMPVSEVFAASDARVHANSQVVQSELKNILSASEYDYSDKTPGVPTWLKKILSPIERALERFVEWLVAHPKFGDRNIGKIVSYVFASLVIVAFLWLLAYIIMRLLAGRNAVAVGNDDFSPEMYKLPSVRPLLKEAAKLAEQGDFRGAFRCAYLASISYLDEHKALRFERSRTNWEYLRELQQGGFDTSYSELRPLTLAFDRKFYGREKCSIDDYNNALNTYNRISSETRPS